MSPSLPDFLQHILDECSFILKVTHNKNSNTVFEDETLKRALVRSIEVIGEAVKNLDEDFRIKYSHVEWKKMAGTRDMVIHHYFGIDYEILWQIITDKIPDLQHYLIEIIEELRQGSK